MAFWNKWRVALPFIVIPTVWVIVAIAWQHFGPRLGPPPSHADYVLISLPADTFRNRGRMKDEPINVVFYHGEIAAVWSGGQKSEQDGTWEGGWSGGEDITNAYNAEQLRELRQACMRSAIGGDPAPPP